MGRTGSPSRDSYKACMVAGAMAPICGKSVARGSDGRGDCSNKSMSDAGDVKSSDGIKKDKLKDTDKKNGGCDEKRKISDGKEAAGDNHCGGKTCESCKTRKGTWRCAGCDSRTCEERRAARNSCMCKKCERERIVRRR